jgi:hypothetical protein
LAGRFPPWLQLIEKLLFVLWVDSSRRFQKLFPLGDFMKRLFVFAITMLLGASLAVAQDAAPTSKDAAPAASGKKHKKAAKAKKAKKDKASAADAGASK